MDIVDLFCNVRSTPTMLLVKTKTSITCPNHPLHHVIAFNIHHYTRGPTLENVSTFLDLNDFFFNKINKKKNQLRRLKRRKNSSSSNLERLTRGNVQGRSSWQIRHLIVGPGNLTSWHDNQIRPWKQRLGYVRLSGTCQVGSV